MADIRIDCGFFSHIKTTKLEKRVGMAGVCNLIRLWTFAGQWRTKGKLTRMTVEDIEIAAGWQELDGRFVKACQEVGFIEKSDDGYELHDWEKWQGFVYFTEERSEHGRKGSEGRWKEKKTKPSMNGNKIADAQSENEQCPIAENEKRAMPVSNRAMPKSEKVKSGNAPSPDPSPSPSPDPSPDPALLTRAREDADVDNSVDKLTGSEKSAVSIEPESEEKDERAPVEKYREWLESDHVWVERIARSFSTEFTSIEDEKSRMAREVDCNPKRYERFLSREVWRAFFERWLTREAKVRREKGGSFVSAGQVAGQILDDS